MSKLKRFTLLGALTLVVGAGLSTTAMAGGREDHKVTLCHQASNKSVQISVARQALSAHMAHGDTMADEYGDCE